jgi:ABC-type bacteriocin/lantibiotic exporter with double-glycine peptidase domain
MVLAYYRVYRSEDDLIYACNCDREGTRPDDVVDAARDLGFASTSKDRPSTDELKLILQEGFHPIVWMATETAHAVVLVEIKKESARVLDPALQAGDCEISLQAFEQQRELARRLTVIVRP